MRKLIIAALLATGSITGQAMATEVHITATNPVIDLSVTEYVDATPDVASFSTGVQTLAPTANEAVRQNNIQMAAVDRAAEESSASRTRISRRPRFR
jgi:uncharacterized protein YggE